MSRERDEVARHNDPVQEEDKQNGSGMNEPSTRKVNIVPSVRKEIKLE